MKKFLNYSVYAVLLMASLTFTACQEEFEELPQPDEQQTIMANSSTAELIQKTASNDGSYDNIVDEASCFSIRFPYMVNVNGIDITIDSKEDLHLIEEIIDQVETNVDVLEIFFPITISFGDFSEVVIESHADLRAWAEECKEGDDDDIECIDFVYPVTLYTFDLNEQQTGSVVVDSDMDLRQFFDGLDENDLISIDFPVTLKLYDGTQVMVTNNAELANAIELAKDACDEDDDNDHNDDDFTQERLENMLVECPWLVREVERDAVSLTDQYFEYLMNFTEDGVVTVKDRMGNNLTGTWSTRVANHRVLLKLEFDVLVDFTLEWYVYELEKGTIKLYNEGGNKIVMESICDLYDAPDSLREILKECAWVIKVVKNQGQEIDRLLGYEFKFMAEGIVTLSNGVYTSEGTWEITTNAEGRLVMSITMGNSNDPNNSDVSAVNNPINFEWLLSDLRNDRLKFAIEEIDYELVLQRVCDDNDGDVMEIRNIMMGGDWIVAAYEIPGTSPNTTFTGYTFGFEAEHILSITNGQTGPTQAGLWRVLRNSEGKIKVYLNAGDSDPLGELTEDWDFVSITEGRLELKDVSGGDGTVSVLVFERL